MQEILHKTDKTPRTCADNGLGVNRAREKQIGLLQLVWACGHMCGHMWAHANATLAIFNRTDSEQKPFTHLSTSLSASA